MLVSFPATLTGTCLVHPLSTLPGNPQRGCFQNCCIPFLCACACVEEPPLVGLTGIQHGGALFALDQQGIMSSPRAIASCPRRGFARPYCSVLRVTWPSTPSQIRDASLSKKAHGPAPLASAANGQNFLQCLFRPRDNFELAPLPCGCA